MEEIKTTEKKIASWAAFVAIAGVIWVILCVIASIVLLCIDAEDYWWIALITLFGGGILSLPIFLSADLILGFSEIVGNTKKIANGNVGEISETEALPEL